MPPDQRAIDHIVRQIVDLVHPLRVILFGSAARGDGGPDSDVDLLVVVPNRTNRRRIEEKLCRHVRGGNTPFDVLVVTESLLDRHKENIGLIYRSILAEGWNVYAA